MDDATRAPEAAQGGRRRPALTAAVPFAGGLIVAALLPLPPWPLAAAALTFAAAAFVFLRRRWATWLVVAALGCGGAAWFAARDRYLDPRDLLYRLPAGFSPRTTSVIGVVADEPDRRDYGTAFVLKLERTRDDAGGWRAAAGKVRVTLGGTADVRYGDRLYLRGAAAAVKPARNPGGFDYRAYLWRRGVTAQLRIKEAADVRLLARGRGNPPVTAALWARRRAAAVLERAVGGEEADLLKALTLGTREEMDPAVVASFQAAGVAHLLAVSGFNVGILALILFVALAGTRLPRAAAAGAVMAILPAYALITGFNPPVVRATVMALLVLGAKLLRRDADLFNLLAAAAAGILLVNPLLIGDASFLLSFAATFALAAFYPTFNRWLGFVKTPGLIRETLAATGAAQLGVLPLQLYFFYRFSPVSLVSNLIMVPLTSVATALSLVVLAAGAAWPALGDLYGGGAWVSARALIWLGAVFARGLTPWLGRGWDFQFWVGRPRPAAIAGLVCAAAAILIRKPKWRLGLLAAAALAAVVAFVPRRTFHADPLRVTFLDAGQADATVVEFPDGGVMVVDAGFAAGTYDAGERVIAPYLQWKGITRIDRLVVTHEHADHAGGAAWLVRNVDVGEVWLPPGPAESPAMNRLYAALKETGTPAKPPPVRVVLGGARVTRLWPAAAGLPDGLKANDTSTVLRVDYGNAAILLAGDAERAAEEGMAAAGAPLAADVLKVPHHGAAPSAWPPFVAAARPRLAFLTTKAGSPRRPAPEALAAYRRLGALTLNAYEHGAARVETDGRRLRVATMF